MQLNIYCVLSASYELIYQLNAVEYLLCTHTHTTYTIDRLHTQHNNKDPYRTLKILLFSTSFTNYSFTYSFLQLTYNTPYAVYVKKFNIHCS